MLRLGKVSIGIDTRVDFLSTSRGWALTVEELDQSQSRGYPSPRRHLYSGV